MPSLPHVRPFLRKRSSIQRDLQFELLEDRTVLSGSAVFSLTTLNGTNGFTLDGIDEGDQSGGAVGSVGDMNGDGFDDFVVGAYKAAPNGVDTGEVYVVFGKQSGFPATFDLSMLDGSNGFTINGFVEDSLTARRAVAAGDVNGDGLGDLLISASQADPNGDDSGQSYIVYGKTGAYSATLELSALNGTNGIFINGEGDNDQSGVSVRSAGDVNGDGFSDVVIGASSYYDEVSFYRGATYVVFGSANGLPATIELDALDGSNGFAIYGAPGMLDLGWRVSSAGDVNGDGFSDVAAISRDVGEEAEDKGRAMVFFGRSGGFSASYTTADIDGTNGFIVEGTLTDESLNVGVSSAGDINGDGIDDFMFSTESNDTPTLSRAYVVFGHTGPYSSVIPTSSINGSNGFTVSLDVEDDTLGFAMSSIGDMNGDGTDDIVLTDIGADHNGNHSGAAYVIYGSTMPFSTNLPISSLNGDNGFAIYGMNESSLLGRAVQTAGDVNGDGFADLIVGASGVMLNGQEQVGQSYLIFGGDFNNFVTHMGDALDNQLVGDGQANHIIAGAGNDTLTGGGGADVLSGGAGDDLLNVSDLEFRRIDGGNGFDTWKVEGTGLAVNLAAIPDRRIAGIEGIDINGSGDNSLTLNVLEVLNLSETSNTLIVDAGNDDIINIGGGWNLTHTELIEGVIYSVYSQGAATLKISSLATVNATPGQLSVVVEVGYLFEIAGDNAGTGTVYRNAGDLTVPLTVHLEGNDSTEATLDSSVVILAGETSATFQIHAVDDGILDETQTVTITATAGGYSQGETTFGVMGEELSADALISISSLNGTNGLTLNGFDAGDRSGGVVRSVGDVNGDGFDDFLIGAENAEGGTPQSTNGGEAYVVFGKAGSFPASIELSTLNGMNGFLINSEIVGGRIGRNVSSAGDVNGDGIGDILIGASKGNLTGQAFVIFGKTTPFAASISLSSLNGTNGFVLNGVAENDNTGESVASAGDVNGDGFDDILIGAPGVQHTLTGDDGAAYVVFGKASGFTASLELSTLNGDNGFALLGDGLDGDLGVEVSFAGDINDDGFDDILVGSNNRSGVAGSYANAYVVFGRANGFQASLETSMLDGENGFLFTGAVEDRDVGDTISSVGDVNGDGIADILMRGNSPDVFPKNRRAYVLFGHNGPFTSVIQSNTIDGTNGFRITSVAEIDGFGTQVSSGDVNGDGLDDIVIGASVAEQNGVSLGAAYVVYGSQSGFPADVFVATLDGNNGFAMFGLNPDDSFGRSSDALGDLNGDGFGDLIVSAFEADPNQNDSAGQSYVLFGADFNSSVTHQGDTGHNSLTGTAAADIMQGGLGNDTLIGGGGNDVQIGGAGDDVLAVSDLNFQRLAGGTGFDSVRLDGSGHVLDLTTMPGRRLSGIEKIDITGSGSNTLLLDTVRLLNLSDTSNTLIVRADSDDLISMGTGWTYQGTELISGENFGIYSQGAAVLKLSMPNTSTVAFADGSGALGDTSIQFLTSGDGDGATETLYVRPANPDVTQYLELTNFGGTPLTIIDVIVNAPDVSVQFSPPSFSGESEVIAPGETRRLLLQFAPTVSNSQNTLGHDFSMADGLVIYTDAANLPVLEFHLAGKSTFNSDLNYDGHVNFGDLGLLNTNFGLVQGDPGYDPALDINGDGMINFGDLGGLNSEFGLSLTGVSELTSEQPTVTKTGPIRTITNSLEILDDDDTQSANEAAARRITPETSDFSEEPEEIVPQFHELVFKEWEGWREPDDVELADQFLDDFQITLEMICNCQ